MSGRLGIPFFRMTGDEWEEEARQAADIGLGDIFEALFHEVLIPPAVHQEVFTSRPQPSWITERSLTNPSASGLLQGRLGAGEREAIALTLEVNADLLFMHELAGRCMATSLGLRVMGTLGVLLRAKAHKLIPAVGPSIDQLLATGFYVDDELAEPMIQVSVWYPTAFADC